MKHFLKTLLLLGAFVASGCVSEQFDDVPTENGIVTLLIDSDDMRIEGELRHGIDCQDASNINAGSQPYLIIPYNNSTSPTLNFTDIDSKSGISIEGTYIPAYTRDEILELKVPLKGVPAVSGDSKLHFAITYGEQTINVSFDISIQSSESSTNELEILGVELFADIVRGSIVQPDSSENQYLTLTYSEGWNRNVVFYIMNDDTTNQKFEVSSDTVKLFGGSYTKTVDIPFSGYYYNSDTEASFTICAKVLQSEDGDSYAYSDETKIITGLETRAMKPFDFSMSYSGVLYKETLPVSDSAVVINYTNGEYRDDVEIELEIVSASNAVDDIYFVGEQGAVPSKKLIVTGIELADSSSLRYYITGKPADICDFTINATVKGRDINGDGSGSMITSTSIEALAMSVTTIVPEVKIEKVTIAGPIFSTTSSVTPDEDDYELTITYSDATIGKDLVITDIAGYLTIDENELSKSRLFHRFVQTSGTHTFSIPSSVFTGTELESNIKSVSSRVEFIFEFTYNGIPLTGNTAFAVTGNEGFVWDGLAYKLVTVGSQTWLDRNMYASSVDVQVPTYDIIETPTSSGDSYDTTYVMQQTSLNANCDFDANGYYYFRGASSGIPIVTGLNIYGDDFTLSNAPYIRRGFGRDQTWEAGYWVQPDPTLYPTSSTNNEELIASYWDSTNPLLDESNPCPPGYRVPTVDEVYSMVYTVSGFGEEDVANSNPTVTAELVRQMNFHLSGYINYLGPYIINKEWANYGTTGIYGMYKINELYDTATYIDQVTPTTESTICIATSTISEAKAALYYSVVQITSDGIMTTLALNSNSSVPVRCIKNNN